MIKKGTHGAYSWFQLNNDYLSSLIFGVQELVVGKYVAIVAYDGEPYRLRSDEIKAGWQQSNSVALSPVVQRPLELPVNQFDEWYIFPRLTPFMIKESFINYGGFSLSDKKIDNPFLSKAYQKKLNEHSVTGSAKEERFWKQLELVEPETYIAETDKLIIVTSNQDLVKRLDHYFSSKALSVTGKNRFSNKIRETFQNLPKKI